MKRLASVLLSAVMLFSLAACANGGASTAPSSSAGGASSSSQPSSSSVRSNEASSSGNSAATSASSAASQSNSSEEASAPAAAPESSGEAAAQAQTDVASKAESKILIAYFSKTGTTEAVARQVQGFVGGDLFRIETVEPYPDDYTETTEIAKAELNANARPAIAGQVENMENYGVVFVGYPIWWGSAPMAVHTFLESYDLSGKTIIPSCTSGGSDIDGSLTAINTLCANATVLEGLTANDSDDVQPWLTKIGAL